MRRRTSAKVTSGLLPELAAGQPTADQLCPHKKTRLHSRAMVMPFQEMWNNPESIMKKKILI